MFRLAHLKLVSLGLVFLSVSPMLAQAPRGLSPTREGRSDETVGLGPEARVLGLRYRCAPDASPSGSGTCEINVTKNEFDALVRALDPNMAASSRLSLAAEYSRLLILAAAARDRSLDQSPNVQVLQKFSALQVLAASVVRDIASNPPQLSSEEIQKYYLDHQREYADVVVSRIAIAASAKNTDEERRLTSARAEAARKRAAEGESFETLQREITGLHRQEPGLQVRLGPIACHTLPDGHRHVCDLPPGEVSTVLADGPGFCIYRLESRKKRPFAEVHDQIRTALQRERVQKEIENIRTPISFQLEKRYFGELPEQDLATEHGLHFPGAVSTSQPAAVPHNHEH
ncbi:MAG TPA: peptidylprolyl isomerase [Terriglobales bacterium]|nr:peptidylprolyl isomerase [Terriglobales bacterium]